MKSKPQEFEGVTLSDRTTLADLIKQGKLHDLDKVAEITGLCVRYLRRLCHGSRGKKLPHYKLLGRYYMTPEQVSALLTKSA